MNIKLTLPNKKLTLKEKLGIEKVKIKPILKPILKVESKPEIKPIIKEELKEIIEKTIAPNNSVNLMQKAKLKLLAQKAAQVTTVTQPSIERKDSNLQQFAGNIQLNAEQQHGIDLALSGVDTIVIGAAGTGKTTSLKGMINAILNNRVIPSLTDIHHSYLTAGSPGIVCCSYTRRSVANMKKAIPQLASNCITIHKLLQFEPQFYDVMDEESDTMRTTMRFVPARNAKYKLDKNIKIIVIDESGTVPMELFNLLIDALDNPNDIQFIYLGDLDQNPPVFGAAVLGYKGLELQDSTVVLTHVYRQALESPIIRLAHRILSGKGIEVSEYKDWCIEGKLHIRAWQKKIRPELAMLTIAKFFSELYKTEGYDPSTDMILMTQNVNFGTLELNKHIANQQARIHKRVTYEIIAGFLKAYYSVGDTVLYEKEDCEIIKIEPNPHYHGVWTQQESITLDYWGHNSNHSEQHFDMDTHLENIMNDKAGSQVEERKTEASHNIYLRRKVIDSDYTEQTIMLSSAAELNALTLGYCLTVHKSQGSEWRKVFLIIHNSNAAMLSRELLYTAVTRAREELYIICEPESFVRGVEIQKIKGTSIKEKLEHFARKLEEKEISLNSEQ